MVSIAPVDGGQYRFAYKNDLSLLYIGVFHSYSEAESCFDVDLYIDAATPPNEVPATLVSLIGLPDLKRHDERTRQKIKVNDITIIDRLYICKNSLFRERKVQWRLGMRSLYRISDDLAGRRYYTSSDAPKPRLSVDKPTINYSISPV